MEGFGRKAEPSMEVKIKEEEVLAFFLIFAVKCPRQTSKGKSLNSVSYASDVVSTVRAECLRRFGAAVGTVGPRGVSSRRFSEVKIALQKWHPALGKGRKLVLAAHLVKIRAVPDLEDSQEGHVVSAIALTAWQAVARTGDLLGDGKAIEGGWKPERRTHRRRLAVRPLVGGGLWRVMVTLRMKPSKIGVTGEKYSEKLSLLRIRKPLAQVTRFSR